MRITLIHQGKNATPLIDISDPSWRKPKPYCWNQVCDIGGLAQPFSHLFLKRWRGRMAPAHDLLTAGCGKPFVGTPHVYGWAKNATDFVYVFEQLPPDGYKTLDERLEDDGEKWLTGPLILRVLEEASACFQLIANDRLVGTKKHVYTDFSAKNIMLDECGSNPKLIDLDSAWSYETLKAHQGIPKTYHFSPHYWRLWNGYVSKPDRIQTANLSHLPKTMILSFAAIWGRALGLMRASQQLTEDAIKLVRNPLPSEQEELWKALRYGKKGRFQQYFQLSSHHTDDLFDVWQDRFRELVAGRPVEWDDIHEAVAKLAAIYPAHRVTGPDHSTSPKKDSEWEIAIPLATARKKTVSTTKEFLIGLFDPFGLDKTPLNKK